MAVNTFTMNIELTSSHVGGNDADDDMFVLQGENTLCVSQWARRVGEVHRAYIGQCCCNALIQVNNFFYHHFCHQHFFLLRPDLPSMTSYHPWPISVFIFLPWPITSQFVFSQLFFFCRLHLDPQETWRPLLPSLPKTFHRQKGLNRYLGVAIISTHICPNRVGSKFNTSQG